MRKQNAAYITVACVNISPNERKLFDDYNRFARFKA